MTPVVESIIRMPERADVNNRPAIHRNTVAFDSVISPPQLTAGVDDYNPTNLERATMIRLSSNGAYNITGIWGGSNGRVLWLVNLSGSTLTLKNATTSQAKNQFALNADYSLLAGATVAIIYDGITKSWRQF